MAVLGWRIAIQELKKDYNGKDNGCSPDTNSGDDIGSTGVLTTSTNATTSDFTSDLDFITTASTKTGKFVSDDCTDDVTYAASSGSSDWTRDTSVERSRKQAHQSEEPLSLASPIQMIKDDRCCKSPEIEHDIDLESPTLEYATYWTMPANRFRLSSTMLRDEDEFDIHRGLPAPGISTIITEAHELRNSNETTPKAKEAPHESRSRHFTQESSRESPTKCAKVNTFKNKRPEAEKRMSDSGLCETLLQNSVHQGISPKSLQFGIEPTTKGIAAPVYFDIIQQNKRIKLTSTPSHDLPQEQDSQADNFSMELSDIPRGDPDVELDVEISLVVNSQEIVALSYVTPNNSCTNSPNINPLADVLQATNKNIDTSQPQILTSNISNDVNKQSDLLVGDRKTPNLETRKSPIVLPSLVVVTCDSMVKDNVRDKVLETHHGATNNRVEVTQPNLSFETAAKIPDVSIINCEGRRTYKQWRNISLLNVEDDFLMDDNVPPSPPTRRGSSCSRIPQLHVNTPGLDDYLRSIKNVPYDFLESD